MWGITTVCTILKNEMYIGNMVQGKQRVISYKVHEKITPPKEEWFIVENTHEAIIYRETFDKAQRLQERDTRTAPGKKQLYLFSGLLRCADCKRSLTRRTAASPTRPMFITLAVQFVLFAIKITFLSLCSSLNNSIITVVIFVLEALGTPPA